jgi:hypothetical protein
MLSFPSSDSYTPRSVMQSPAHGPPFKAKLVERVVEPELRVPP